jgi:Guanylate-binding protein, N-terminal domain
MPLFGSKGVSASKKALPFIEWDEKKGKFAVNADGAKYLSSFEGKIAVTIVAGRYRSGKSFLMNQLLGGSGGFSVGHTVESHTKGIWLSGEAVEARTSSGESVPMLFMDSEGLGATDKVSANG